MHSKQNNQKELHTQVHEGENDTRRRVTTNVQLVGTFVGATGKRHGPSLAKLGRVGIVATHNHLDALASLVENSHCPDTHLELHYITLRDGLIAVVRVEWVLGVDRARVVNVAVRGSEKTDGAVMTHNSTLGSIVGVRNGGASEGIVR